VRPKIDMKQKTLTIYFYCLIEMITVLDEYSSEAV